MLKLKGITKDYPAGEGVVHALRGIDLEFRENEFVSILGPSGSGKTTLLNIIGGLDQYTQGDLVINGTSTKDFKDKDWDAYRNYTIGFVFQSYNLIPHQTVLQNVELALTVSGVSKDERRKRAKKALEDVGLGDQINKTPNQMSGGQMQRVAIARALVNDPDIILADEPTGALDTETSKQVLNLLKEIADDRLIIMVTHNPKLAEEYSSRIINMLDGKLVSDTRPLSHEELIEIEKHENEEDFRKKTAPSMSFATSFMLSLKNLFTKKGRTTLTAFAGSIGIMGIALVIAISQGMTSYINDVQEDALTSYPLTIEKTNIDISTLMDTFMGIGNSEISHENDAVYKKSTMYDMITALNSIEESENDLKTFKIFLEDEYYSDKESNKLKDAITGIQYGYDLGLNVYTKTPEGDIIVSNTESLLQDLLSEHMGADMSIMMNAGEDMGPLSNFSSLRDNFNFGPVSSNLWQEMLSDDDSSINEVIKKQYDVVYGSWPSNYNEVVLVLDENNELDDMTLYALGLESKEGMDAIMNAAINGDDLEKSENSWTYKEILDKEYKVILNSNNFTYDEASGTYIDLRATDSGLKFLYDDALDLKVSGIIKPNEISESNMLSGSIVYTKDLTEYVVSQSKDSKIVSEQLANEDIDIITGLPFKSNTSSLTDNEKKDELVQYINQLNDTDKVSALIHMKSIPLVEDLEKFVSDAMKGFDRQVVEQMMLENMSSTMNVPKETVEAYVADMSDEEIKEFYSLALEEQYKQQYKMQIEAQLSNLPSANLLTLLEDEMNNLETDRAVLYYDEVVVFSENTYESNLSEMGYIDLESPSSINIYASSFENKNIIENTIATYNDSVEELSKIKYTDFLGIMMSSITTIINAITYVLLAFIGVSLIVSSIMIGVITLISVQERTKEIGILRAIGASKKDVSSLFNAETMIIGFASGALGIIVTVLLTFPINYVLNKVTGIANLKTFLPPTAAAVLILISVILSLFAGIIPSRSAAKKDPVVALRTE